MGSILPIGRLLRTPSTPAPRYNPYIPPPPAAAPETPATGGSTTNTPPTPSVKSQRERNLEERGYGFSGLVGTSLRGLLGSTGKIPQRKTLLGE
jgi:hypothetical protein